LTRSSLMKHRTDRDLWPRRGVKAQRVEFSALGPEDCVGSTRRLASDAAADVSSMSSH
jgi:hypothetical protein